MHCPSTPLQCPWLADDKGKGKTTAEEQLRDSKGKGKRVEPADDEDEEDEEFDENVSIHVNHPIHSYEYMCTHKSTQPPLRPVRLRAGSAAQFQHRLVTGTYPQPSTGSIAMDICIAQAQHTSCCFVPILGNHVTASTCCISLHALR